MVLMDLVNQWSALLGIAALIAAIINILKSVGIVKDGYAGIWSLALNLLGLILLFVVRVFHPSFDVSLLDSNAAQLANVLVVAFGFLVQIGFSKVAYLIVKGLPLIGKSFTVIDAPYRDAV